MKPTEQRRVAHLDVGAEAAGQRLDNFLLATLKGVPRSHVYRLIRSGQVRVNSGRSAASYRIKHGDRVRVPPVRAAESAAPPPAAGLAWLEKRIVHEDARLLVLDKPAGLAVHGGSGVTLGCIEALRSLRPGLDTLELAHRLDRGTSGCLLVAKRRSALRALHALLREGGIDKRYLALVAGVWPQGRTRIDVALATSHRDGEARARPDPDGRPAVSEFTLLERYGDVASFVEVAIATGRTHQIRVHAAHAGHPIAGDDRYGDREFNAAMERLGLERMFLHAHAVAFRWPETDTEVAVSVPLPDELKAALDALSVPLRSADRGRPRAVSRRPRSRANR